MRQMRRRNNWVMKIFQEKIQIKMAQDLGERNQELSN